MKIKATKNEIRECVSRAVYRLLKESDEFDNNDNDNLDDVEANDAQWASQDDDEGFEETGPTEDDLAKAEKEFEGNDDLIDQAIAREGEKEIEDNGITFTTDLNFDDDVDCQIMDELEDMFDAEIDDSEDPITVTVDSSMVDKLENYFQEHQIEASREGGLYESRMRQIIRESIRKTLKKL